MIAEDDDTISLQSAMDALHAVGVCSQDVLSAVETLREGVKESEGVASESASLLERWTVAETQARQRRDEEEARQKDGAQEEALS
eukprot:g15618.t1